MELRLNHIVIFAVQRLIPSIFTKCILKKETRIQLESELESVNSDISNMKLHLNMLGLKKKKTEGNLDDLLTRKRQIESSLKGA
ncbi:MULTISPECIES: hypothetical protein [Bacillus]|uniref:hypothetical protein n=1 Tax=Bacillus TaxID=1386 RepID=UPI0007AB3F5A|nr:MULTISPECIES: hypothetical protein [Bacillus]MCU0097764.1 hypothetical protein [Bacillus sp. OR9]MBJ8061794.1 hypothetical protein [Bacillus cereus]MCU4759673.1 hypothetical protein [Bacillus cereus]MCU5108586.1 hypothetical protein [Bacillus cereus]MCU5342479.1 hypothetical protein [Bacillus cereus]